jgi:NAD(P)-dependent dehydrogenase (short-subunit alcohol dehydrogenase family)
MFDDLAGRTAVVTGGARGLGFSIASALARQGVSIALLDLLPDVTESAVSITTDHGVAAGGYVVDAVDADAVEAAFDAAAADLGTASILVTAAGITIWGDSTDVEPDAWNRVLDVNLNGTFFAAQSFARRAADSGLSSSAIFVSSMSGFIVNQPQFQAAYNASKAAVSQLAKSLAVEWATRDIRVNAIAPGYFLSDMTRVFTDENPDLAAQWIDSIPLGRMGEPADLDGLIVYLASTASSYLTGQSIIIDGGYTAV